MDMKEKYLDEFTNDFNKLVSEEKLNINSLEDLMIDNIEKYECELRNQTEKLLKNNINEKELIIKKNKNGEKKDIH